MLQPTGGFQAKAIVTRPKQYKLGAVLNSVQIAEKFAPNLFSMIIITRVWMPAYQTIIIISYRQGLSFQKQFCTITTSQKEFPFIPCYCLKQCRNRNSINQLEKIQICTCRSTHLFSRTYSAHYYIIHSILLGS